MDPELTAQLVMTEHTLAECERRLRALESRQARKTSPVIERHVVSDLETPKRSKTKNRAANQAAIQLLIDAYPQTFSRETVRPLKVGIQNDLVDEGKVARNKIKRALASYVRSPQYYRALQEGAERIDLAGQAAGVVSAEEAEHAKQKLKEFHQRRREQKRAAEKQAREKEQELRLTNKLEQLVSLNRR